MCTHDQSRMTQLSVSPVRAFHAATLPSNQRNKSERKEIPPPYFIFYFKVFFMSFFVCFVCVPVYKTHPDIQLLFFCGKKVRLIHRHLR